MSPKQKPRTKTPPSNTAFYTATRRSRTLLFGAWWSIVGAIFAMLTGSVFAFSVWLIAPFAALFAALWLHALFLSFKKERSLVLLQQVFDGLSQPLCVLARDGTISYANTSAASLFGVSARDVVGAGFFDAFLPGESSAQLQAILSGVTDDEWQGELQLKQKQGQEGIVFARISWLREATVERRALLHLQDLSTHRDDVEREQRAQIFRALPDIVLQVDIEGELLLFHGPPSLRDRIVIGVSVLAGIPPDVMPPDVVHQALHFARRVMETGEGASLEFEMLRDGQRRDYVARFVPSEQGMQALIFVREISDRKHLERALEMTQHSFQNIIERNQDGIVIIDHAGIVRFTNPAATRFFHRGGATVGELFDYPLIVGTSTELEIILDVRDGGFEVTGVGEMRLMETRWVEGEAYLASIRDITERKHVENRLQHQAFHDMLTGLPNRALLLQRMEQAMTEHSEQMSFAVLFMDLDRFKNVNDSLGHDAGDQLLVDIALRLGQSVRVNDTVARLGGDEFVVLLEGLSSPESDAANAAAQILASFTAPFVVKGQEIYTSGSIGIALGHGQYTAPQDVLRDADTAMYRAKDLGKSRYVVFDQEMHLQAQKLLRIENDLQRAIEQNEFLIYLQPIASLETEHLTGFEVLVRWLHPQDGMIFPGDFIEVAEDTGLIVPIGWWVMKESCRLFCHWQQLWSHLPPLQLSVNLSARQVAQPDLVQRVLSILEETGLPPQRLKLEITESALIEQVDDATAMLEELRGHRIQVHMDDFGTGYSSLSYLHRFPIDGLKIDRAFVNGMESNKDNAEIVRAIVSMAHSLGLSVTAEGAENIQQIGMLQALRCERVQGYALSRPVDVQTASALAQAPDCYVPLLRAAATSRR